MANSWGSIVGRRVSIGKESVCCIGTSTTSDARRPMSASIGQGRSHGSRGQVDKSPFPARRSVAEKKRRNRLRARGRRDGGEARQRRRSGLFSPPDSRARMSLTPKEIAISKNRSFPVMSSSIARKPGTS